MNQIIVSDDEIAKAAGKLLEAWDPDSERPTERQVQIAFRRWLEREIEVRLEWPGEWVWTSAYSNIGLVLNAVRREDAQAWCNANKAKVEKAPPPGGWRGEWTRITAQDGTSADGFDLVEAFDKLQKLLTRCYWCGNAGQVEREGKATCATCGRDWQGEAA